MKKELCIGDFVKKINYNNGEKVILQIWDDGSCLLGVDKNECKNNFLITFNNELVFCRKPNTIDDFKLIKYNQDILFEREISKFESEYPDEPELLLKNLNFYGLVNKNI